MKSKKILKTLALTVLGVVVAALVFLGVRYRNTVRLVFNWENLVSFVNSLRYDKEDIESQMVENKQKMEQLAEKDPNINIRGDLTEEEQQALKDGLITNEQAIAIVKGDTTLEEILKQQEPEKEEKPKEEEVTQPVVPEVPQDRASEIIAELYVLQADFISRLEAIGDRAYEQYKATRYNRDKIMSIVDSYTGEVHVLESECDKKVRELVAELETELKKVGGDVSVAKEIHKYYYKEKGLKKAYYLDRLNDEDYK